MQGKQHGKGYQIEWRRIKGRVATHVLVAPGRTRGAPGHDMLRSLTMAVVATACAMPKVPAPMTACVAIITCRRRGAGGWVRAGGLPPASPAAASSARTAAHAEPHLAVAAQHDCGEGEEAAAEQRGVGPHAHLALREQRGAPEAVSHARAPAARAPRRLQQPTPTLSYILLTSPYEPLYVCGHREAARTSMSRMQGRRRHERWPGRIAAAGRPARCTQPHPRPHPTCACAAGVMLKGVSLQGRGRGAGECRWGLVHGTLEAAAAFAAFWEGVELQ